MTSHNLIQVMQAQTVLMNELALLEKRMLAAILNKDATEIQSCMERNDTLSNHLEQAESVRVALLGQLAQIHGVIAPGQAAAAGPETLERLMLRLGAIERSRLAEALREFRLAVQNLANFNQALRMYTEAQLVTLDSFLAELLPRRNEGIYGSDGRQASAGRAQLLNRQA